MIIIPLQGGLGNQLFQYAFARTLTLCHGVDVSFDVSFFESDTVYTKRKILLDEFQTVYTFADKDEIAHTKYPYSFFSKAMYILKKGLNKYVFKKYYIGYSEGLIDKLIKQDSYYAEGYFQSYEYVLPVLSSLRNELELSKPHSQNLVNLIQVIESSICVAVHIRRGDYTVNSSGLSVLAFDYYERAVPLIKKTLGIDVVFCVYTDDISLVKKEMGHLFGVSCVYANDFGLKDFEELYSMRYCAGFIIANSSFSWWGAVLAKHAEIPVIAPKDWNNPYVSELNRLCPPSWKRV